MLRKSIFLLFLNFTILFISVKAEITNISYPKSVDVYDLFEITFQLDSYDNPYDPDVIDVYALFTSPEGKTYRVNGFYYEGYLLKKEKSYEVADRKEALDCWRIRFSPDSKGQWTFAIHAVDQRRKTKVTSYNGDSFAFECQPKASAEGFIRQANTRYLKREAYLNSQKQFHSYFPVGPNVAWYSSADYNTFSKPYGIYDYEKYIDSLDGNANYMRVWLTRYQYLSLYGPENTMRENGTPVVFFNSTINQKDAAELDWIVDQADRHGLSLMLAIFTFGDFRNDSEALESSAKNGAMPSGWMHNPYHTKLGLSQPIEFFSDPEAKRITRNLLRYIVARWGYATNILCWELFNEVENIFKNETLSINEGQAVIDWHREMYDHLLANDPHRHLVTTSFVGIKALYYLQEPIYKRLDFVQAHNYQNVQKAKSKEQMSKIIFDKSQSALEQFPTKPFFLGEYGLTTSKSDVDKNAKDPFGFDLHNSLWSSVFAGGMGPASYWYWDTLKKLGLFKTFKPVKVFCDQLPLLSDSFEPMTTGTVDGMELVFPNNIDTYYLINASEDTVLGWCQDDAYNYQSLRRLTDNVDKTEHFDNYGVFDPKGYVYTKNKEKKPEPSSRSNIITIPIDNQRVRTEYAVRWFDTETGLELTDEATVVRVRRRLFRGKGVRIEFPSSIRDLENGTVNNTYGDAAFILYKISD